MIVCEPTSGLTSRIYVISDAYELAKKYGHKLVIIWNKTADCNCRYDQVFDDRQFEDVETNIIECNRFCCKIKELMNHICVKSIIKTLKEIFVRILYLVKHTIIIGIYRVRCDIYKNFYLDNNELFDEKKAIGNSCFFEAYNVITGNGSLKSILFKHEFIFEANSIVGSLCGNCIGVHIRRTDHRLAKTVSTTAKFVTRMKQEVLKNPNVCFFVSTDDVKEQEALQKVFDKKIVSQPQKVLNRDTWDGIHCSIIDVLCLSKTKYILGSNASVFSKFAAEYGSKDLFVM